MYKILAIVGKAGSGKDTIMQRVLAAAPGRFHEIISATTRPPREGEVDGKNYHFKQPSEFGHWVRNGYMLEYTQFNNWYYGTPIFSLVEDKVNIGVFNPAGVRALSRLPQVSLAIAYVYTDDKTRMMRQLCREEYPNVQEIVRRFQTDEEDFEKFAQDFERDQVTLIENSGEIGLVRAVDTIMTMAEEMFGQM